jgi:hypothetical protein
MKTKTNLNLIHFVEGSPIDLIVAAITKMTIGGGGHHHDSMIRYRPYLHVVFGDRPHGILRCEDGISKHDSSFLGFVGGGPYSNFGKNES